MDQKRGNDIRKIYYSALQFELVSKFRTLFYGIQNIKKKKKKKKKTPWCYEHFSFTYLVQISKSHRPNSVGLSKP